jgi:multiple sugar transport system substrate-binding protein
MRRRSFMALAGAGIATAATGGARKRARAQSGTTIQVFWNKGFYEGEDQALQVAVNRWQQQTGNRMELSLFSVEDTSRRTIAALEANTPPDIAYGWQFDFNLASRWAFDGRLVDLSEIVAPARAQLFPVALQAATYLNGRTNQRAVYALPINMQTHHVHYWRDMMMDAGIQEAQIPGEWSAFWRFWGETVQPAVRRRTGNRNIFGAGSPMSTQATDTFYNTQMFLNAYGVTILDEQGRLKLADTESRQKLIQALGEYASIFQRGWTPPGSINWGDADNNVNFHNRTLVMTMNPSVSIPGKWLDDYNQNRTSNPAVAEAARDNYYNKIRTVAWPDPQGRQIAYPVAVKQAVIFQNSRNIDAAKSFLKSLYEGDNLKAYNQGALGRWFPVRQDHARDPFWTTGDDPHRRVVYQQYTTRPLHPFPMVYDYRYADLQNENVWGKALGRVLVDSWTMERAVDEMIARMRTVLQQPG